MLHFTRRLVGEGDRENFGRVRAPRRQDVRNARRQHAGLAGSGTREHQHRPVERFDRLALLGIESVEIRPYRGRAAWARAAMPPGLGGWGANVWRCSTGSAKGEPSANLVCLKMASRSRICEQSKGRPNVVPRPNSLALRPVAARSAAFPAWRCLRPAASGSGSSPWAAFMRARQAATSGGKAAVLLASISTCSDIFSEVADTHPSAA